MRGVVAILNYFIFFIAGIFFVSYVLPILDQLLAVVLSALENVKGLLAIKTQKLNNTLTKLSKESEPEEYQQTHVIGFQIPSEEEYYEEDEDEDED